MIHSLQLNRKPLRARKNSWEGKRDGDCQVSWLQGASFIVGGYGEGSKGWFLGSK
jgi:hypothetical protein